MTESELTLLAPGAAGATILEQLTVADDLAGYAWGAAQYLDIRDVYWDTPDYDLMHHGFALRVREQNGAQLIALKGEARVDAEGLVTRLEIEGADHERRWQAISRALANAGVVFHLDDASSAGVAPRLQQSGLCIIQDRRTRRVVRAVVAGDDAASGVELALDTVHYHIHGNTVIHCEIELEAVTEPALPVVRAIARWLLQRHQCVLRVWPYNKLVTGMALGELPSLAQSPDTVPGTEVYDRLETLLANGEWAAQTSGGRGTTAES